MEFTYLSDYKPYPFDIPIVKLNISIQREYVVIQSHMRVIPKNNERNLLVLRGKELNLQEILIDNEVLDPNLYRLNGDNLEINYLGSKAFILSIKCKVDPFSNTALEGIYASGGMIVTQCEAEGFRRIMFHPDRPDVLSRFEVTIEADINEYPILLSNGNLVSSNSIPNRPSRHEFVWKDPFPKPSYLFALVAGKLDFAESSYKTKSGRLVQLRIYVDHQDKKYTKHAMQSLKKAMLWDERVYGFEYDLDEFNIVAVRHFNMGAMENKGLNIFNSKLVLADNNTATDLELERIESVIAHEYFHNWTGNRITCRDWFQLSLKEGLTVYREQCFTASQHSESIKRIDDVMTLRNTQFSEDAGPTSHAVKPTKYLAIDNFYTTTIYEKGAELVRMLETLVGHDKFIKGIDLYVRKFDGSAATTENFVDSILDSTHTKSIAFEKSQFIEWYYQAGTPVVSIRRKWDNINKVLTLLINQSVPSKSRTDARPLVIPLLLSLIGKNGPLIKEKLLILKDKSHEFKFKDLHSCDKQPALSVFRKFSAPVKWNVDTTDHEYLYLIKNDDDPFAKWDACQSIMRKLIISRSLNKKMEAIENDLIEIFKDLISTFKIKDLQFLSSLLSIPKQAELEDVNESCDPLSLYESRIDFMNLLGKSLFNELKIITVDFDRSWESPWPDGQGERKLISLAWRYLAFSKDKEIITQLTNAIRSKSMTLSRAALIALQPIDCKEREDALDMFYQRWKDKPVILDTWFGLMSSTPWDNALFKVKQLIKHEKFDKLSPNCIRSVLGGLFANTPTFHSKDGSGYRFMAEEIIALDKRNSITASRMTKLFSRWRGYASPYREGMYSALELIRDSSLSVNTKEVIDMLI